MSKGKIVTEINPSQELNWTLRKQPEVSVYPAAVCRVNGEFYQICCFYSENEEFYSVDAENFAQALNMSVGIYGIQSLTQPELANIAVICEKFGINPVDIDAFEHFGIKGRQNLDTLKSVAEFDHTLKNYLCVKDIPLKVLAVFIKLQPRCKDYVLNTISQKDISVGDFRKLVNLLFDMQNTITDDEIDIKSLGVKQDASRIEFMQKFGEVTAGLLIKAESPDSFETGKLVFSFTAETPEEYAQIITEASDKMNIIKDIFRFLDEQNIS